MYTDFTPLPFGKHKFTALCRIPADYLLSLYADNKQMAKYPELESYIAGNMARIIERAKRKHNAIPFELPCIKIMYATKAVAKEELKKIKLDPRKHKKPIRCYKCPKCGGWHLTSIPMDAWAKPPEQKLNTNGQHE